MLGAHLALSLSWGIFGIIVVDKQGAICIEALHNWRSADKRCTSCSLGTGLFLDSHVLVFLIPAFSLKIVVIKFLPVGHLCKPLLLGFQEACENSLVCAAMEARVDLEHF